ncbi:MAG: hypothetical protein AW11_00630 [Candidatus Accumulibacter regalis]|jgi:hypothetical protein|uniref:Transmembrane protein n=1 Tax=Accumulibacter regalis TaxID=522306 RepID=A0A011QN73_ACCRE|nr:MULTISPECIES: hypothetical protein [unclassified Candidatus Accumulibacter]EXI90772.1 MAG: hypothetical protein AW11_00630 [Candidatus Accumulibacter regalis]MQM33595.1 hypothetical protein [Candidatus Accumulibacter phosphatis]MBL8367859.1 hypothetical protein [Accumulibacter sp.]MBN8514435.1 hypothetical protein [Accumulibacter sp.]MBO3702614.1 hypothetical protein [Accumulibacter sp.]
MKPVKKLILGVAVTASVLAPLADANAWVAAGRGWGGRGFVAAGHPYHGGYYHGGGYYHRGCYGCGAAAGAVAGLAVGAMTGAAIASAAQPVVVQQPVYVAPQPVYVAPQPTYVTPNNLPIGSQYAALPPNARHMTVNGAQYYQSGPNWYKPYFGSSGVYYEVVLAP